MPNNGKLYKYRSIRGEAFNYAFDSLANGYLWLPKANQLNDDEDTTVSYDPVTTAEEILNYIVEHPVDFMFTIINSPQREFKIARTPKQEQMIKRACDCIDYTTGKIDRSKALRELLNDGMSYKNAVEQLDKLISYIDLYPQQNIESIKHLANLHLKYNDNLRDLAFVYSMTEDYDCDQMWAYYADSNNGFCIEYNFNLAKALPLDIKRKLVSLFKVEYKTEEVGYSFIPLLKWYMSGQDPAVYTDEGMAIFSHLITKKQGWQHEREWRLFLTNTEHKLIADIVSGIIIDERALTCENGQKLITLAQTRGWKVSIRRTTITKKGHSYHAL